MEDGETKQTGNGELLDGEQLKNEESMNRNKEKIGREQGGGNKEVKMGVGKRNVNGENMEDKGIKTKGNVKPQMEEN